MEESKVNLNKKLVWGALAAGGILAGVLLWNYPPTEASFWPKCVFHRLTGLLCPGCGATRGLYALLHGEVLYSLQCNLFLIPLPILCLLFWRSEQLRKSRKLPWVLFGVVLAYWILRNLPFAPCAWLRP